MYKVGDMVRVLKLTASDEMHGIEIGQVYKVVEITGFKESILISVKTAKKYLMHGYQVEKVEDIENMNKEMTFPEMVQKLIDAEFEVGTE